MGVGVALGTGTGVGVWVAEVGVGVGAASVVGVGVASGVGARVGSGAGVGVAVVPQAKTAASSSATAMYRTMLVCTWWCMSNPLFTPPHIVQRHLVTQLDRRRRRNLSRIFYGATINSAAGFLSELD